ncbi:MAG: sigma-54 dependent transcriptional regulator [Ignavibacteria bacterium]|nr:sigma-54 dependent transcriptional regulator [Ignavibacteria bacterium]
MNGKILIADDEKNLRNAIAEILQIEGFDTDIAADGEEALNKLNENDYDIVLCDIRIPKVDGMQILARTRYSKPETAFIMMTAYANIDTTIQALRHGAYDYIQKPIDSDNLIIRIKRFLEYKKLNLEVKFLRNELNREVNFFNIVGQSEAMKNVFNLIEKVSQTDSSVLITGKSGTGKELVAKAIHYNSARKNNIFLPVNCGAIPENLIETELFGHRRGSFTGAVEDKEGLFKIADNGTLFLDEISELPLPLQVKLLRVLESGEFMQVGGTKSIKTNVRIIAATNRDLHKKIQDGTFREDLFYRINVVEIKLPTLSERREDIPLLVAHFIEKYRNKMGKKVMHCDNATMKILYNYEWKGGVRELENVIERALIFANGEVLTPNDLPEYLKSIYAEDLVPDSLKDAVKYAERKHILKILKRFKGDKVEAAKVLDIGLSSLYRKMEELGLPTNNSELKPLLEQ